MESLSAQLAQLESAQLVRRLADEELTYLFKHALTQEAAYQSLLLKTRREIHRLVAEAYERLYPDRLEEFAALLAQHYAEAGDDKKTFEYATRAGDAAARIYANAEAVEDYSLALHAAAEFSPTSEQLVALYEKLGRTLEVSGNYKAALANYDDMARAAEARGDQRLKLAAMIQQGKLFAVPNRTYDPPRARTLLGQALSLAQSPRSTSDRQHPATPPLHSPADSVRGSRA
jgi:predicted ATPase